MDIYEQKYKEALGRANAKIETYNHLGNASVVKSICEIFPELKECEDERIRKAIIYYLDREITVSNFGGDIATFKEWISWLEKQDSHYTFEIKRGNWYKCVCDYMLNGSDLMFKNGRLYYCRSDWSLSGEIDERNVKNIGVNGYKSFFRPATNQEIKDWLEKQGENISLPKFTFDDVLALQCCIETVKKVQEDKELYEQLQSLHDRLHDAYWLEKQGEQKPAEIPMTLDEAIAHCEEKSCGNSACASQHQQLAQWLKELKEYKEQKPVEWSEEEKARIDRIVDVLDWAEDKGRISYSDWNDYVDYVKSLKPQPHWKPSEKQMDALDYYANSLCTYYYRQDDLRSLFNALKKL